ncbi:short-chain dehydrogenase/reductase 2b-like [Populus alba x Populus x berolinensis]|nr:short-chain dehydrogenase/reductase 2b-like [Populus alba x Populus x berolinensis]
MILLRILVPSSCYFNAACSPQQVHLTPRNQIISRNHPKSTAMATNGNHSRVDQRYAVVTGANKGIGLETVRQIASKGVTVVLTARDEKRGTDATCMLHNMGLTNVVFHQLDVLDPVSIESLAKFIKDRFGRLDILRIRGDDLRNELGDSETLNEQKLDSILKRFLKDLKENTLEAGGWSLMLPAYSISKATLNAYTRVLAKRHPNMLINCVHPGYVNTDINWHTGPMPVEEGARGPVKCALLPDGGPTGCYFDQTEVASF